MKKISLFLFALIFSTAAIAQRLTPISEYSKPISSIDEVGVAKGLDTVFMDDFFSLMNAAENFHGSDHGYAFGTNWDSNGNHGPVEQAQGFFQMSCDRVYHVGALIWTGIKSSDGIGSDLYLRLCKPDSVDYFILDGDSYPCIHPGTVLARDTVKWEEIDTSASGWTIVTWNPYDAFSYWGEDYFIVYNLSDFYSNNDTLSIVGGDPVASVYGCEFTLCRNPATNGWLPHIAYCEINPSVAPLEAAIAIFPIVDCPGGIGESDYFIDHMQLKQNVPNPSDGRTSISYTLDIEAQVILEVFDAKGRIVFSKAEGCRQAGSYSIIIDANMPSGIYYYSLMANGRRLTKRMVID